MSTQYIGGAEVTLSIPPLEYVDTDRPFQNQVIALSAHYVTLKDVVVKTPGGMVVKFHEMEVNLTIKGVLRPRLIDGAVCTFTIEKEADKPIVVGGK